MILRTIALALALTCGFTTLAEAKKKPGVTRVKTRKNKAAKAVKGKRVQPRKVQKQKLVKRHK